MLALFGERGGDPARVGKRDALDPLLWQAERPGEPAWDTQFGHGRPGWHIECTAIALHHLGNGFDVQGGGSDLIFPHHEMGTSQAHLLTGERPFAKHFVHAGMVGLNGQKMSKSKGNLVFVSRLRDDGHHPMAIRLALLAHHYRTDWEWTRRRPRARARTGCCDGRTQPPPTADRPAGPVVDAVRSALATTSMHRQRWPQWMRGPTRSPLGTVTTLTRPGRSPTSSHALLGVSARRDD